MTTYWIRSVSLALSGAVCMMAGAHAEVTVIVNAANPASLDDDVIASLFLGQVRSYPGGGDALPINQPGSGAVAQEFAAKYLKKTPPQLKAYWSKQVFTGVGRPPKELEGDEAVMNFVAANPGAIGYVEASKLIAGVKALKK